MDDNRYKKEDRRPNQIDLSPVILTRQGDTVLTDKHENIFVINLQRKKSLFHREDDRSFEDDENSDDPLPTDESPSGGRQELS
ncbi:hypothetical protein DKX38_027636 [Salix brachista]|uniref:Uncharacterized protein n=1 Tax=Salix brachista TaxID=2182728 RepID=A0A5N5J7C0_9ROSI|nr:hypothetical protein DKX38_027636 [Salix brachista]